MIIAITIHKRMLKINPAIPSLMSIGPDEATLEMSGVSTVLNLSTISPRLSFNLTPLYKLIVINEKNASDKIVVEMIEFSKNVLCRPRPQK
jgi:hypothetical protein